ncbi:mechanosensitive ion channel family protein [Haloferax mediterranei ATCC 33500]|uniref:Mechanosensitive ion channel family protein n=1 Tax=Haloferax mediterranei (strain ATCC 33500 / DSM 1411 / JCM 8866 / NBRC 14739 / NCIMB 2177 / R-4) TaxID=523841 RepID=I3R873_HALMT|nr:mechanosensitive ion channel family protein [Haloferax mediterranei]AFK20433.1 MscS Mechanosensitive ion channel [Haloferax mediterranei ATCC 33500]AHZ23795.1 mechanosensitive ion channel protein MscS [Haloferax mediterranei ATCC 33500]ELZ98217.1 mechanosensitive ion channel protein MscS [Haloferax mediterranei ATCC 33500]MDX5986811.1 mechanosensitive ion channel family protein [Haloferax mediterranei ATCC 33500]QCQ76135.1 mechanosensitive ion channel family protein [Haloferax mediterranei 
MTLPALDALLTPLLLRSTSIALQTNGFVDFEAWFPTFELRLAASIFVAAAVIAIWRLGARLHDMDVEGVSSPVWHLGVTVLRLTGVVFGGTFLFAVWSLSGDIGTLSEQYNLGKETLIRVSLSAAFLVGAYVLTSVLGRFIKEIASTRPEISDHQREIIYRLAQVTTYLVATAVVLGIWEVNLGGLLVGAGFLGIVVGMAARQTLGALIAGFVLMFSRPFEIGDWVEVGNHEGIVTEITVVNTRIQTFDGEFVMIPNDVVSSESLVNRSRKGRLRLDIDVGVDYETDLDHAASVAQAAVEELDEVLSVPKPQVVAKQFGDSAVVLGVRPWIDRPSARRRWRARTAAIGAIHEAFADENITIPFPQRELSGREQSGAVPLTDGPSTAAPEADGGVGKTEDADAVGDDR